MNRRTVALAVVSGLLLAITFPAVHFHIIAWVALSPLLLALRQQSVRNGFWLGGLSGIFFFAGTVYWVTNSVHFYGNVPLIPASFITLLLSAYLALYPALFGAAIVYIRRRHPALFVPAAPAVWTALELVRTYVFSGFPWALLGYSQYSVLPVIQIADTTGVYGISFLVVLANAGLADFVENRNYRRIMAVVLLIMLVFGYGFWRLHAPPGKGAFTVSVIQGNIEQDKKWDSAYQAQTIDIYKKLTQDALRQDPDLVVWPETATPFYFSGDNPEDRRLAADLVKFVKATGVPLLFGSPTYEVKKPRQLVLYNSAFLLVPDGTTAAEYRKLHLVPFGEYVPLKRLLFFVEKMVQTIGDFASGTGYTIMKIRDGSAHDTAVSTVICYEIIFPDLVRKFVDSGAAVITTITNDAWFGKTAAPYQHFSMAVFRAVENRVPVARAANTGISGFIDSRGHVLAFTDIFTQAHLTRTLTPRTTKTLYTRYGDVFSYLCVLFSLFALIKPSRKPA